ncbi:lysylphosphatidylglycerol synthase transmembrane domain-containing protein [Zavarzinella formosa]|uniref:lysylphosphatidylglycerol synthase transmembrane domain-containing protein n=1 Tax=Zavarzinella formosa TaxID=360055 RepID=UPI0002E01434|nr:lysylphosphatidylglycerol synthase transmembrane domain-containing protein [Zavarzinella formosa]
MKSSLLKNLFLYVIGFGLLALVIQQNWASKPGKTTHNEKALTLLAGSLADSHIQLDKSTPGIGELLSRPVNVWYLLAAATLWSVASLITFYRWYVLVRAQDLPFTVRNAIRLGLVGSFFNAFLPGAVGGDILKAVFLAREQSRRTVAVATIVVDRVLGLWALGWLVAVSGGLFWLTGNDTLLNNESLKTIVRVIALIVIVSGSIFVLMGMFSEERSTRIANRLERISKVGGSLAELWRAGVMYRQKLRALGFAFCLTIVGHLGWVFIFYLCVSAFPDVKVAPFSEHLLVVPVGMTAQALFPMPGGVGGGEAAYGWLYTLLGVPATGGILGCLVQRIIAWGIGLIGYLMYTRMKKEIPSGELETESVVATAA